eukprot:TRINITY_DN56426_c0_g1_i1.p1 TRINITY_DN56426_c0_g1~~TRINITY_DN56426_c0_g1_i1.p1  ORF type:complete len:244 (+),score=40.17 TRINITY_DN56426_c0_g1_i1:53-733(+)
MSGNSPPLLGKHTALIVVDVQPEYWSDAEQIRRDFPSFPACCGEVIALFRARSLPVVHVRADYRPERCAWLPQFQKLHASSGKLIPSCVEPLRFEEFATPRDNEVLLGKPSWSATSNTPLVEHLRDVGVDTCVLIGLITSVCVHHSAFGLFDAGFRTLLVGDACADRGRERHEAALMLYGNYMYELVSSAVDLEALLPVPEDSAKEGSGRIDSASDSVASYRLLCA